MEKTDLRKKGKSFLVLTRREGEAILITTPSGETIEVGVKRIKGAQVRIGIKCDRSFDVKRIDQLSDRTDQIQYEKEMFV